MAEKSTFKNNKSQRAEELLKKHGELGNFLVKVQHRQNGTWQGKLTWLEEGKTVSFRSVWEMIKLMENALGEDEPEDEIPDWD